MHWFNICMCLSRCILHSICTRPEKTNAIHRTPNWKYFPFILGFCSWQQTSGTCSPTPIGIILWNTFIPLISGDQKHVVNNWCLVPTVHCCFERFLLLGVRFPDCSATESVWYDHFQHSSMQMGSMWISSVRINAYDAQLQLGHGMAAASYYIYLNLSCRHLTWSCKYIRSVTRRRSIVECVFVFRPYRRILHDYDGMCIVHSSTDWIIHASGRSLCI